MNVFNVKYIDLCIDYSKTSELELVCEIAHGLKDMNLDIFQLWPMGQSGY
jgi:hypothetical protein